MGKNLDLKFSNYLKDMQKKNVFKALDFQADKSKSSELEFDDEVDVENEVEVHEKYEGMFEPVKGTSGKITEDIEYMNLIASLNSKAEELDALGDEELEECLDELGEEAIYKDVDKQKIIIEKIKAIFVAYEKDDDENLFYTDEDKKAANKMRKALVKEIPDLFDDLSDTFQEALDAYESTDGKPVKLDLTTKSEIFAQILNACGELRSDLMDVYKVYFRVIKAAEKVKI